MVSYNTDAINELDMETVARCVCGYTDGRVGQKGSALILKRGTATTITCPEHNDHSPSCSIYHNRYYCFACGAKGDNIKLVSNALNLNFQDACKAIADEFPEYNLALSDDQAKEHLKKQAEYEALYAEFPLDKEDIFWLKLDETGWAMDVKGCCESVKEIPAGMSYMGIDVDGNVLYGVKEKVPSLRELWRQDVKEFNGLVVRKSIEMMTRLSKHLEENTIGKAVSDPSLVISCNNVLRMRKRRFEILFNEFSGRNEATKAGNESLLKKITKYYSDTVNSLNEPMIIFKEMGKGKPTPKEEELEPYESYTEVPFGITDLVFPKNTKEADG